MNNLNKLFKNGYWNYRFVQKTVTYTLKNNKKISESYYDIHEIYYNEKNEIIAWSEEPMQLNIQSYNDYKTIIKQIKKASKYKILKLEKLEDKSEKLLETNLYIKNIKEF